MAASRLLSWQAGSRKESFSTRIVLEFALRRMWKMIGLGSEVAELLDASYDSVDRMVLNAYFSVRQTPGGFRTGGGS